MTYKMNTYAQLFQFCLPMESGIVVADRFLKQREGFLVKLSVEGHEGWGEISPLPGISLEDIDSARHQLIEKITQWLNNAPLQTYSPSVEFGFSCAIYELTYGPLNQGNFDSIPFCSGDPDELFSVLEQSGTNVATLHIGHYEAIRDGMIVNLLLEALPDLTLRLEGQQRWRLQQAMQFANAITPEYRKRIHYLSEPCKSRQDAITFAQETDIPLAWNITSPSADYEQTETLRAIVIKPTLVGSLDLCLRFIKQAQQRHIDAIISSSYESSFALTQLSSFATQTTPKNRPNLNTLERVKKQLIRDWPNYQQPIMALTDLVCFFDSRNN